MGVIQVTTAPQPQGSIAAVEPTEGFLGGRRPPHELWIAFLGGERVWVDSGAPAEVTQRFAALIECIVLSFHVILLWTVLPDRLTLVEPDWPLWAAPVIGTIAAFTLWLRPFLLSLGRTTTPASLGWRATWRFAAFAAISGSLIVLTPGWLIFGAWTLGVLGGADLYLSIRALGIAPEPWRWWVRFVISPVHFGILGAIAAALITGATPDPAWRILGLYGAMHLGIVLGALTVVACVRLQDAVEEERDRDRQRVVARERAHRIHWLHDDVLSEVRIASLRVRKGGASAEHAARELDELDHRLRLRQLDEIFQGGPVRLAEILQPHLRRAQSLGVEIIAVPSLDAVGQRVDEALGRRFQHAVSVLLSNAINAGATQLAVTVKVSENAIELRMTDNAGGFDFAAVPAGRGLDRLMDEVGHTRVRRYPTEDGSTMAVRLVQTDKEDTWPES